MKECGKWAHGGTGGKDHGEWDTNYQKFGLIIFSGHPIIIKFNDNQTIFFFYQSKEI